jgi:hypothetical protein
MVYTRKNDGPPKGRRSHGFHILYRGVTETIGGTIAAFQTNLVGPCVLWEVNVEVRIKGKTAIFSNIRHHHLPAFLMRIELVVP